MGSRIWEIDWYQNEWPWILFRGRIKVLSTIALHSTLKISETVRDRGLVPKDRQWEMAYGLSNGHVIDYVTWPWKVKLVTPIRLERISKKNSWRCYLATIANYCSLLWGSTVGYRSNSLVSCKTCPFSNCLHPKQCVCWVLSEWSYFTQKCIKLHLQPSRYDPVTWPEHWLAVMAKPFPRCWGALWSLV